MNLKESTRGFRVRIKTNKSSIALVTALAISMASSAHAANEDSTGLPFGLDFSAFGDVQSSYDDTGKQQLDWGSAELDVSAEFSEDLQGALAVVVDKSETMVAVAFLDFHTSGGRIAPRGRLWAEKGLHVQVGQFDVPFGNDWQFFASLDSVSISRPLSTDLVMDGGYNDTGIRILGNNGSINFNTFLLHGFNSGRLVGSRLGLTPFSDPFSLKGVQEPKTFEFGLSYLYDANSSWKKNEIAWAADAEVSLDSWTSRFEYMVRKKELVIDPDGTVLRAWHVTQEYALDEEVFWPTTFFARYEKATSQPAEIQSLGADAGDNADIRIATGFKTSLGGSENVQWKFEVQHYRAATPSTREMPDFGRRLFWYTQLVLAI